MKYKLVTKSNPSDRTAPQKWYANSVNAGSLSIKEFAKSIAGRSSLTRGDIENVLNNFLDELPVYLKLGLSVKLGDFGSLRLNIASEGVDTKEAFSTAKIKGVKVIFAPSQEFKSSLKDVSFEELKSDN
jgi:predicted histone-like DNA-binding protein